MDGHIDQSAPFVRTKGKRRDGTGYGVIEATVEGAQFICGNWRLLFDGQPGDDLAHITVNMYYLIDAVFAAQQLSTVQSRGATYFLARERVIRFFITTVRGLLLNTKDID